ncbi:MAG: nitroreductase family protein [Coriobacteriia bacterium]|nr:nitroreductase family protein [Coriobacteriia bacterium]
MDALEAILTRRSIRKYTDEPVSEEAIATLLDAAMAAPSAMNERSTRIVVVRDRDRLESLSKVTPFSGMLAAAQVGFVVCGDILVDRFPGMRYWTVDGSAATENLLVAANALGLGAVWIGVYPWRTRMNAVARVIGLPRTVRPLAMVALGWPVEPPKPREPYDMSRIHHETW